MAEDWSLDVRKYVPDADQGVIDAIVRYLGIALRNRDSSLVSFSDKTETDRVRENFLKKKLGLTDSDADLDVAIAAVGERMKADRTKNRVTVYYLLAEAYRKLSVFGGVDNPAGGLGLAAGAAAGVAGAAGAVAAAAASIGEPEPKPAPAAPAAPPPEAASTVQAFSARPAGAAAGGAAAAATAAPGGGMRWLLWLLLGLALLALLWWLLAGRNPGGQTATTETAPPAEAAAPAVPDATAPSATADATAAGVAGAAGAAGAAAGTADAAAAAAGFPAKVFFATGSAAISADGGKTIEAAAGALKAEGGGKATVTAYTDRTGNLAQNQELAKNRAKAVRDALVKAGVPLADIEMRPPATVETGAAGTKDAEARRVDIGRP
ncbi:DUF2853 family protein [Caulobacter mirabilis]|uniref:OmpA-like domain-containing protein n=1 Tax=Caulobacter mirabilis TaxID=69666 RepID=A0A2D2AVP5_9CAUL|nr:DUF2853 family protein [Caulobacter mirabilis]ATQ42056.1 hypothetical protein CSW64_06315 [Caulobacter mirabilis]